MADFNVRSDQVDVEQIMRRVRARIREKRGVDYTDQEVRELANVKLEKFLDPKNVRSDLVAQYRRQQSARRVEWPENFAFESDSIYESSRLPVLRTIRRLLNPLLKLFFNPNALIHALHLQSRHNAFAIEQFQRRDDLDALNFEVLNNLVVEMTRLSIEVKNLRMRMESLATRLDFDERRARALEGLVEYRAQPEPLFPPEDMESAAPDDETQEGEAPQTRARRRRRRGRRRGPGGPDQAPTGASFDAAPAGDQSDARDSAGESPVESPTTSDES